MDAGFDDPPLKPPWQNRGFPARFRATLGLNILPYPVMRVCRLLLPAVLLACASGCGVDLIPGQAGASGNWAINPALLNPVAASRESAVSNIVPGGSLVPVIGGSMAISGTTVSANFYLSASPCFIPGNLAFAGTVTNHQLTLTSDADDGQVISLEGMLSTSGTSILGGTFTIQGGCADGESGSFNGLLMPSLTGTWTGTATVNPPAGSASPSFQATVSLQLQQSLTAMDFWFPLSGSLQISGSPCGFSSGTLLQNVLIENLNIFDSSVAGYRWWAAALMNDGSQVQMVGVFAPPSSSDSSVAMTISGGTCDGYSVSNITLTGPSPVNGSR